MKSRWQYSGTSEIVTIVDRQWGAACQPQELKISRASLLVAIQNVKDQKSNYTTEDAWQTQLDKYQGALAFMEDAE